MSRSLNSYPEVRLGAASKTVVRPEFDLLLACCGSRSDSRRPARIGLGLDRGPNWLEFARLTEHHAVGPLVYRALSAFSQAVPGSVFERLRRDNERNVQNSLWLARELIRILDCLESHGVPAIPYKGPVLAKAIYGDIALRRFADLDILIRARDLRDAKAAVGELGYTPTLGLNEAEQAAHIISGNEVPFDGPLGRRVLELQWRVLPRFYAVEFSIENFFQRSSLVDLGGRLVRTLAPEDLLLVLCVHAAKHVWWRLSWLCDIAETVRSQPIDYISAYRTARELGIERIVAVNFLLQSQLFGVPSPLPFRRSMKNDDPDTECLADVARQVLIGSSDYNFQSIEYFMVMLRLRERLQDRFRFLVRLIFTPSKGEWLTVRLPAQLFLLYRVIRVFRLVAKFLTGAFGSLGRTPFGSFRSRSVPRVAEVALEQEKKVG